MKLNYSCILRFLKKTREIQEYNSISRKKNCIFFQLFVYILIFVLFTEAVDPEDDLVRYDIVGGNEFQHFLIEESTGEIRGNFFFREIELFLYFTN